jgi:hypothetical protein
MAYLSHFLHEETLGKNRKQPEEQRFKPHTPEYEVTSTDTTPYCLKYGHVIVQAVGRWLPTLAAWA